MVNFNPNFPDVLGNEWLVTRDHKSRVWGGAPAAFLRLPSTVGETVTALKMSAAVNPLARSSVPTLIDIYEEGNEVMALPQLVSLVPNSDATVGAWRTEAGGSSNLFQTIDGQANKWPNPVIEHNWIQCTTPFNDYECTVDAAAFHTAGSHVNARIMWVAIEAVFSATPNIRNLRCDLEINGVDYQPAGGNLREVHAFGAIYPLWYGEINPATSLPWTPADIAQFRVGGNSKIKIRSQSCNASLFPRVHAIRLNVHCLQTENRAAVGVWRRPEDMGNTRLQNITTDALRTYPAGSANWGKLTGRNYLYFWRQSISPSEFGPTVADDVRWNGAYQELPSAGIPSGKVFPLHFNGDSPAPSTKIASRAVAHDHFGRPQLPWVASGHAGLGLAQMVGATPSVDSQPYRLDLQDVLQVSPGATYGQRITPASTQTYAGFRLPVIPPFADSTLTVRVHRVSDGVQIGGSFTIHAADVGALPSVAINGLRYVTGFFSSTVTLVGGTQYEIRLVPALLGAGVANWITFGPDCSLAPTRSFGGNTSGAVVAGVHDTNRDVTVNLLRQPDPPTAVTATITDVPVTTYLQHQGLPTVEHVLVEWTLPAVGMAGNFKRYDLERSLDGGTIYFRIGHLNTSSIDSFMDHEAPRDVAAKYRIRAVGVDGRISIYNVSGSVTPTGPGEVMILTSNHDRDLEVVYFFDHDSTYPILSTEGDETVRIHGSDAQVVFMEAESRGIGWRTGITIDRMVITGKGGHHVLTPLLNLIRPNPDGSLPVPYVCVLDDRGTQIIGHVSVSEPTRQRGERGGYYTAPVEIIPVSIQPIPVEVS